MGMLNLFGMRSIDQELLSAIDNNAGLYKIKQLLNDGANPNIADTRSHISRGRVGQRPLHYAAHWRGNHRTEELVSILIKKNANPNLPSKFGHLPIHYFASKGDFDSISLLLKAKSDVNVFNSSGHTPLHNAAQFGHPIAVELLINHGADVNARVAYKRPLCDGNTPMHSAVSTMGSLDDRLTTISLLISAGADVSISTGNPSLTPLQYAESLLLHAKHGYCRNEEDRITSIHKIEKIMQLLAP